MSFPCHATRIAAFVLLAALGAWPLTASAQDVPTVKIGQATKKTVGTVTALTSGDVACYLTLKDDRGAIFEEMADFDICNQKPPIKGKRVTLSYALQKVQSDECAGDPNCRKTRTVALVSAARIIEAAVGKSDNRSEVKPAARPLSFCTPTETVVFACRTGAKMASVCASKDAGPGRGYLQYRFGKLDGSEPLEQTLPEGQVVPAKAATGENVPFAGGGGAWLKFRKGKFAYTVYTGIGNWGPKGKSAPSRGFISNTTARPWPRSSVRKSLSACSARTGSKKSGSRATTKTSTSRIEPCTDRLPCSSYC